jgi:peptidoglycan/LPS O-acetylase OafA/YrhL
LQVEKGGPSSRGGIEQNSPDNSLKTTTPTFLPALTSLRGIAAWYVVLFHFREYLPNFGLPLLPEIWAQGYLSVDLFFELSGFVVTLNYLDFLNGRGSFTRRAARFLWLRLGRIYPLHIVVLCLMAINPLAIWLFSANGDPGNRYTLTYFLMSVVLVQNWGFSQNLAWNIPAWSISTEWFVYLLFPAYASLIRHCKFGAWAWVTCALALFGLLAAVSIALGFQLGGELTQGGLLRCVLEFLIGSMVYCAWARIREHHYALYGDWAVCASAVLGLAYILLPIPNVAIMPGCFALIIYGLADTNAIVPRLLASPLLQWVGTISYSTYLIHYLVRDWVKFLVVHREGPQISGTIFYLLITLVGSAIFYYTVEVVGRNWSRRMLTRHF